jgi:hypothetical protein
MQPSAIIKCPHCGKSMRPARAVAAGEKVRCPHCSRDFESPPLQSARTEDPDVGDVDLGRLRDLLGEEAAAARAGLTDDDAIDSRYPGVTNMPLSARAGSLESERASDQPFARNPLAPASERSKDRLIGGKGVRFLGSRALLAVTLAVAGMGAAYGCFVFLQHTLKDVEDAGKRREKAQKKKGAALEASTKKVPPAATKTRPRKVVPEPYELGDIEVVVNRAYVGPANQNDATQYLSILLAITNKARVPKPYLSWTRMKLDVRLRDQYGNFFHRVKDVPVREEQLIDPGKTIQDTLWFDPVPVNVELSLDLPIPGSSERWFQFLIPAAFIQRAH